MIEILSDCTKFVEINEDWKINIFRYQDKVSLFVDKLYECSKFDDCDKKSFKNNGSTPGKIYRLPKVHKKKDKDVPLRPLLSTIGTRSYKNKTLTLCKI